MASPEMQSAINRMITEAIRRYNESHASGGKRRSGFADEQFHTSLNNTLHGTPRLKCNGGRVFDAVQHSMDT
jgi:hypothetical protein